MELEPPEVPLEISKTEKKGFFAKLFGKKENTDLHIPELRLPEIDMEKINSESIGNTKITSFKNNINIQTGNEHLPELPNIEFAGSKKNSKIGKSSGKKKKDEKIEIKNFDESKSFDWSMPANEQRTFILDSNRNNPDVSQIISGADAHVDTIMPITDSNSMLTSSSIPEMNLEHIEIPEPTIGTAVPELYKDKSIDSIEKSHNSLRKRLENKFEKFNKKDFMQLLREYDNKIELRISRKGKEFSDKRQKLENMQKLLSKKEHELKYLHTNLESLNNSVKQKETKINDIITNTVEKELKRRLSKEKSMLKKELLHTMRLNKQLKSKLATLEKDMDAFDTKKAKVIEEERTKLTKLQQIYDTKLRQLDQERREFEQKRDASVQLLKRGDEIAKELDTVNSMKRYLDKTKISVHKELIEDKELKKTISMAERKLKDEQENLDQLIFSRYIESKLKSINATPDKKLLDINYGTHPIYNIMTECKEHLSNNDVYQAKKAYTRAKVMFETSKFDKIEKALLYDTIRSLYNDIQLATLKS